MIYIATIQRREVVSEKLERYNFQDGQEQFGRGGDLNNPVRKSCHGAVSF